MKKCVGIFFIVFMLFSCGPKKFMWQGQHASIETVKMPKEDFVVDSFVVVGYDETENEKYAGFPYSFVILKDGKQIGTFFVIDRLSPNYMIVLLDQGSDLHDINEIKNEGKYYLEGSGSICEDAIYYLAKYKDLITYKSYNTKPSYKYVKSDVKTVLLGGVVESE